MIGASMQMMVRALAQKPLQEIMHDIQTGKVPIEVGLEAIKLKKSVEMQSAPQVSQAQMQNVPGPQLQQAPQIGDPSMSGVAALPSPGPGPGMSEGGIIPPAEYDPRNPPKVGTMGPKPKGDAQDTSKYWQQMQQQGKLPPEQGVSNPNRNYVPWGLSKTDAEGLKHGFAGGGVVRFANEGQVPSGGDGEKRWGLDETSGIIHTLETRKGKDLNTWVPHNESKDGDPNKEILGPYQIAKGTWDDIVKRMGLAPDSLDRYNPEHNKIVHRAIVSDLMDRFNGDPAKVLAAYNAGPGVVDKKTGYINTDWAPEKYPKATVKAAYLDPANELAKEQGLPPLNYTSAPSPNGAQSAAPAVSDAYRNEGHGSRGYVGTKGDAHPVQPLQPGFGQWGRITAHNDVQDRDLYGKPITQTDAERDAINNSGITRLPAAGAETTDPFGHHLVKAVGSIRDAIFPPGVLPSSKAPVVRQMEAAAASLKAQQDSAGGQPAAAPNGWLGESGATQPAAPKQPASDPNQSWLTAFRNGIEKTDTGPYQDALGQYKANSDKAYARDAKERGINSLFAFAKGAMGASQHASVNLGQGFGDMAASRAASTKEMGSNDALRAVHGLQGEQSLMNAQFAQTNNSNMAHVYGRNALAQHERNMLDAAKAAWDARESTYKTKFSEVIAALNAANMMGKMNLTPDQINAEAHKQALDFTKKFTGSDAAYGKINSIGDTGYMNGSLDYNTPGGVPTYKVDPIGTGATAGYMPPTIPAGGITGVQPTALTNPQG